MQKKTVGKIGIEQEVKIPLENEVLNPRDEGGNTYTVNNKPRQNRVKTNEVRPSTGEKSKYPYEVTRKGVVRK